MLLGWTRLLDEWVVGLTRYNRTTPTDPVCWADRGRTLQTLVDAATRVRSFAYRDTEIEPTVLLDDETLSFELQGRAYRVAADQHSPGTSAAMIASGAGWLESALLRAETAAEADELPVGVVFVTPHLAASEPSASDRAEGLADRFIATSRQIGCRGCAFSFPDPAELDRYRYGNEAYPGALILLRSPGTASPVLP